MEGQAKLARYFELSATYARMFADYEERGVSRILDARDKEFTGGDESWRLAHYFGVGADALWLIVRALHATLRDPPRTILDFPSGSGRVTRHLRAFFPAARVVACDLYDYHVAFCRDVLGAVGVMSCENFDELDFGERFDVIFCGSLLTHLPEHLARSALRLLARSLSERGIAIATLHGRHSDVIQARKWKYLSDELYAVAAATVPQTGFGYVAYDHDFKKRFDQQSDYGVALVWPRWMAAALEQDTATRLLGYEERAWDDHQDVVVFGRPGIHD
jgi:SAM-dependent methyltransferase